MAYKKQALTEWPPLFRKDGKVWTYVGYKAFALLAPDDPRTTIAWELVQANIIRIGGLTDRLTIFLDQLTDSSKKVIDLSAPVKVAIVGSRKYKRLDWVREYVRRLNLQDTVISGGALGVDSTARDAARECGLSYIEFPADWDKHGKSAGMIRNHAIVGAADRVVAFMATGGSKGTQHSIDLARLAGKLEMICFDDGTVEKDKAA